MIGRLSAGLILVSQMLLISILVDPTGERAILYAFVGHPVLALGLVLGFAEAIRRRRARNRPD